MSRFSLEANDKAKEPEFWLLENRLIKRIPVSFPDSQVDSGISVDSCLGWDIVGDVRFRLSRL